MKTFKKFIYSMALLAFAAGCKEGNAPEQTPAVPENGDPIVMHDFTVTLTDLKAGYVYIDIKPKDKDMTYYFNLVVASDAAAASDDEIIAADMANFRAIAAANEYTVPGLLAAELKSGEVDWRYAGLMQNSEYCIYLYGLSTDGEAQTSVNRLTFTTPAVGQVDCGFEILISQVQATSFSVTIVPEDDNVAYFYDVFPAAYYEEWCGSTPEGIIDYLPSYITELAAKNSIDIPYAVSQVSAFGTVVDDFSSEDGLMASSNYYVFAVGIGPDGTAVTMPVVQPVTTAAPPANTFSLLKGSIGHSSASYTVSPAHNESYVAIYERKSYMYDAENQLLSDEQIIEQIVWAQGSQISDHLYSGNATVSECPLIPDEEYYLLVFGYFGGKVTTSLTKDEFRTSSATQDDEQSFTIMKSAVTQESFEISCNPYLTGRPFVFNYMPYSKFLEYGGDTDPDGAVKKYNTESLQALHEEWEKVYHADFKEYCHRRLSTDYVSYKIEDLEPGTDYLVYAIGMTADGVYTTSANTSIVQTKAVMTSPELEEILPSPQGTVVYMYFYFNQDSGITKYAFKCSKELYDMSDDELYAWFTTGDGKSDVFSIVGLTSYASVAVNDVTSGTKLYYAGILYGADDDNYTIIRHEYTAK